VVGIKESLVPCSRGKSHRALILGTGGSSKAVAWTLKKMGCETVLVSRRAGRGVMSYSDISPELMAGINLVVNTTPLGMFPDIDSKPEIDYNLLTGKHILFDLVYNPEMTAFLKMGKERGCKIITGMKMLRSQAERSWEIWNDENL
jgi:shikimate dehydrogenase